MKHLGILATTPEGAALCFRAFCQAGFAELGPHDHPDVTLDCIALARSLPAWQAGNYPTVRATLSVSLRRLAAAGADFFACPDNTAHLALEQPGPSLPLPGLHIAEVVAGQAARDGRQRVGVLGTSNTMTGPVYPQALAARQIVTEIPGEHDRRLLAQAAFDAATGRHALPAWARRATKSPRRSRVMPMPASAGLWFRAACPGDAHAIAGLHADSWQRHYRGAYSDAFLDNDAAGYLRPLWTQRLAHPNPQARTILAERDGEIVGLAHTILGQDPKWGAFIGNLHVAYGLKRQGICMATPIETTHRPPVAFARADGLSGRWSGQRARGGRRRRPGRSAQRR